MKYQEYLASEKWKKKRATAIKRADGICERCQDAKAYQVHHKTYKRLFRERSDDLLAVCGRCHAEIHEIDIEAGKRVEMECSVCPGQFATLYIALRELLFFCDRCGHTTVRERRVVRPRRTAKSTRREKGHKCHWCDRRYLRLPALKAHMNDKHPDQVRLAELEKQKHWQKKRKASSFEEAAAWAKARLAKERGRQ